MLLPPQSPFLVEQGLTAKQFLPSLVADWKPVKHVQDVMPGAMVMHVAFAPQLVVVIKHASAIQLRPSPVSDMNPVRHLHVLSPGPVYTHEVFPPQLPLLRAQLLIGEHETEALPEKPCRHVQLRVREGGGLSAHVALTPQG